MFNPKYQIMKNILFALAIALMATVSCGKQNTETGPDSRLVGTSYKTTDVTVMSMFGYAGHVFEFDTATTGVAYWVGRDGKQNGSDGEFTYTLDYPNMTVVQKKKSSEGTTTLNFVFQDSRTFYRSYADGTKVTYYKQ